tara:strand:+ start:5016 stop:5759 length:744 start_codon:yes stop_codon:yes gene_type:complete
MSIIPVRPRADENIIQVATCTEFKKLYIDTNTEKYENKIDCVKDDIFPFFDMKKLKCVRVLISGSSGSGKTYMTEKFLDQLKPEKVYLFSSINDDDYKDYNVIRIDLNEILNSEKKLNIHDIYEMIQPNSVCIFDDVVSYGVKLSKPYLELRLVVLQKGRHKQQSVFVVEQLATAGNLKGSQSVLLNCNYYVMFPKNNVRAFTLLSKNYLGIENSKIEYLKNLKSRYLFISKNYPSYYVSAVEVGML